MRNQKNSRTDMTLKHTFKGCRFHPHKMNIVEWNLRVYLVGRPPKDNEGDEFKQSVSFAFHKLHGWLEYFINDVIVVDFNNKDQYFSALDLQVENQIILTPTIASDDVLAQLFHAKMRSIVNGDISVEAVELESSDCNVVYTYTNLDGKYDLPSQEEFVGKKSLFDKPWWERNDCDTYDFELPKGENKKELIKDLDTSKFFDELKSTLFGEEPEADIIEIKWKK